MKLKNYLSLSYLVYFLFVVSFIVMTGIIGYLMFQNIMGYSEKSHAIVYSHPIILSSDQGDFTTFNQDDLTIQLQFKSWQYDDFWETKRSRIGISIS